MVVITERRKAARQRAEQLGVRLHVIEPREHYWTSSQSQDDTVYHLRQVGRDWICECPGFQFTSICKHVAAVELRAEREGWAPVPDPAFNDETRRLAASIFERDNTLTAVEQAIERLRAEIGLVGLHGWRYCAERLGLVIIFASPDQFDGEAAIAGWRFIVVRDELPADYTARLIWHEIGHAVLHHHSPVHAGNVGDVPERRRRLNEMEREAWEFAHAFPLPSDVYSS